MIIGCGKSPGKLVELGDKYILDADYDKAVNKYQQVVDKFPDDSLAGPAQYHIARIHLENKNDYQVGYHMLNEIVKNYPDTELTYEVEEEINNFPYWLMNKAVDLRSQTHTDSSVQTIDYLINEFPEHSIVPEAKYLLGNIQLNDKREFHRAIVTYQELVYKYPGSKFEPMSKFMIGYIYANILNDVAKAKTEYSAFLQKFPRHELAPSVQFELEYLGRSIEDISELTKNNK